MSDRGRIRIGLDGYNLAMAQGTGVATYGRTLGAALAEMGHPLDGVFGLDLAQASSATLREVLFFAGLDRPANEPAPKLTLRRMARRAWLSPFARRAVEAPVRGVVLAEAFKARLPPFDRIFSFGNLFEVGARYFRRYGRFLTLKLRSPPAIMHWTYPLPIRLAGARNIYTIHDLVPLRLPQTSTEDKRYHYELIRRCLTSSAHVCTVSEASRADILQVYPDIAPAQVTNTYQVVPAPAETLAIDEGELRARLSALFDLAPRGYFLYYGALEPKKNLGRLIEAYLGADLTKPLIIVGGRSWKADDELRILTGAHGVGLTGLARIRRLDYLPRHLLLLLVRGARAVLFPSLYEGFGLPVVEAMALGTPVMTSTASCLPEIAGEAAFLVDPYDIQAMEAALRRLHQDDVLCDRLASAGPQQASRYSTTAYATRLQGVYSQALSQPLRRHPLDTSGGSR